MPPQNCQLINQALDGTQNAVSSAFKPQQQQQPHSSQGAFTAKDVLDIDELMSYSTEQTEDYQQVVSSCLSKTMGQKERRAMFNLLAKNINLVDESTCDQSKNNADKADDLRWSNENDSDQSDTPSHTPDSSSSNSTGSGLSCQQRKTKERQKRRPRRYKYNPKPLIEKTGRKCVPNELKDEEYWEKRSLNNQAARKTREERRAKELEVLQTIERLQKDNTTLKDYLTQLEERNRFLIAEFTKREQEV